MPTPTFTASANLPASDHAPSGSHHPNKQRFFRSFVFVFAALAVASCSKAPIQSAAPQADVEVSEITAGYLPMVSSLTYFVAEEQGFFAQNRIKLRPQIIPTSNDIAADLIRGQIDVAIELSVVPLLTLTHGDARFRIFSTSIIDEKTGFDGVVVKGDSDVKELRDLSGRKVLLFPGTTAERTFAAVFQKRYQDTALPIFSKLPPNQHLQALLRGEFDAVHAYEPFLSEAVVKHGCRKICGSLYGQQLTPSPIGVGAVNADWLKANPEVAKRFFAAIDAAVTFIQQNPSKAREVMSKWTKTDLDVAYAMNIMPMTTTKDVNRDALQRYLQLLVEMREITATRKIEDICIPAVK